MYRRAFLGQVTAIVAATLLLPAAALGKPSETEAKKEKSHKHKSKKSKHHATPEPTTTTETTAKDKIAANTEAAHGHKPT
jgi:mannitol-specific phosphotransferase system IIBC component